jgi:hypothetical protein
MSGLSSLFVVALPRSLSSVVYHASRLALGLEEPLWTSDGEILNNDRFALYGGPTHDAGVKYVRPAAAPELFQRVLSFIDQVTLRDGFAYKDVVQPFVAAAWLPASGLRVLRVRRRLADVAFSMLQRQWFYPANASAVPANGAEGAPPAMPVTEVAVIRGLLAAERELETLPGETVEFEDLIADENALIGALRRLYPEARLRGVRFIDEGFRQYRDRILARRNDEEYRRIESVLSMQQDRLEPLAPAVQAGLSTTTQEEGRR